MTTHLFTEGLFHSLYTLAFCVLSLKLWLHSRTSNGLIARFMSLLFLSAGLEYACLTITIFLFAHNFLAQRWLIGVGAMAFCMLVIACALRVVTFIVPAIPLKPLFISYAIFGAGMVVYDILVYKPTGMTKLGTLNVSPPTISLAIISFLLLLTCGSIAVGFIYNSFKRRVFTQVVCLGIGFLFATIFLPLTYQANTYSAFIFFSCLTTLGFLLLVSGIVLHPFFRTNQPISNRGRA